MSTYYLRVNDLGSARGEDERFRWQGQSPQDLAQALEQALRDGAFIERWRSVQPEPETLDEGLFAVDPTARVDIDNKTEFVQVIVSTRLFYRLLAQRLNLLIGTHWTLGDVK